MDNQYLIVGSGPSLRRADLDLLRGRCVTIAVNCAVFYAPWADILFAGDESWWQYYGPKITWFKGRRVIRAKRLNGVESWRGKGWVRTGGNSGHTAIQYATDMGAKHIALIGFDQQRTEGRAHVHPDHPHRPEVTGPNGKKININLGNLEGVAHWPGAMAKTAPRLAELGVTVVNLSIQTALDCFPRMTVEQFLKENPA